MFLFWLIKMCLSLVIMIYNSWSETAIVFSSTNEVICAQSFSHVWLCDPMDCIPQGSSVRGIFQKEYWSRLPFPPLGDLPSSGWYPYLLHCRQILYCWVTGKPEVIRKDPNSIWKSCPHENNTFGHRQKERDGIRTQGWDIHWQSKERDLEQILLSRSSEGTNHADYLELPAFRTRKQWICAV